MPFLLSSEAGGIGYFFLLIALLCVGGYLVILFVFLATTKGENREKGTRVMIILGSLLALALLWFSSLWG